MIDLPDIKARVRAGQFRVSWHAETEAEAESLDIAAIVRAILDSQLLESYPDTGRGESCLLVGFSGQTPIHVVCGLRGDNVVIITTYVPQPPWFSDPWTRKV